MTLDNTTVIFTSLLFASVLAIFAWAWSFSPGARVWRRTWAVANTLVLVGVALYLGEGSLSGWLAIILANVLILSGYLLLETGLWQFIALPVRALFVGVYLGIAVVGFVVFTFVWDSYQGRTMVHSALAATVMLHAVLLIGRAANDVHGPKVLIRGLQSAFLLVGVFYLIRIVLAAIDPAGSIVSDSSAVFVTFLFVALALTGWTLGFVAMEMNRTQRELERTLVTRERMFTLIAHDLRGPLGNLMMMLRTLKEGDFGPADIKETLETASAASDETYSLVENLLGWAQVQRGGLHLNKVSTSLAQLVDEATRPLVSIAATKEIVLVLDVQPGLEASVDVPTMTTVVRNLVSNALKFTPRGGRITIESQGGDAVRLVVRDTGPGFPPGLLARLKDGKLPLSMVGSEGELGTGLGLPLCQDFVRLNGGTLHLASSVDGTTITIHLPG